MVTRLSQPQQHFQDVGVVVQNRASFDEFVKFRLHTTARVRDRINNERVRGTHGGVTERYLLGHDLVIAMGA